MHRANLKTALRFLNENRVFAVINALGLSLALAASFIILLYVINEFSYNRFNKNSQRIYRVINYYKDFDITQSGTPYVLASTLKQDFPQIEKATKTRYFRGFKLKVKDEFISIYDAIATDSETFDIFTLPLIMGSSNGHLLDNQNSIVISRDLAEKLFQRENPVGKEIIGMVENEEHSFVITGVFENIPVNSTLRAQCFVNSKWTLDPINKTFGSINADENWTFDFWITWILLSKSSDANALEKQFSAFETKYISEEPHNHYSLQKLSDVYLRSDYVQNTGIRGNMKNVKLFSLIAFLIILVASINYIILSTAVSSFRAKEIGIRKTFGAGNTNIRNQMLSESVLMVVLVLPVALILTWIALPYAGKLFQKELHIIGANILTYISVYITLTILIGIASGLYTSTYLSKLRVLDILKNVTYTGKRKILLRSSLIVIQLVIFCSFVACMLTIRSQYQYAIKKDTGHYKHNIIQIELGQDFTGYKVYINNIRENPHIISAAGVMEGLPMLGSMSFMYPNYEDKNVQVKIEGLAVDYNFIETMGIKVIQGRAFSDQFGSDLEKSVMLNETAVTQLSINDPVGKTMGASTIIGIVKDFNLHSIHSDIPPLEISMTDKYIQQVVVRYEPGMLNVILPMLEAEWKKIAPDRPFTYATIEDLFKDVYSAEKSLTSIVTISAIFTILIAVIGLFGLTLFIATTRTKEIGIKKVLGSSEQSILYSLLFENIILVLIATILSVPITIYFMTKWLNNYSYKVSISWWIFLVAFVIAVSVVLLTVYFHSFKASRTNPIDALRYE
jgi:putative ABC transport system permease protein